MHYYFLQAKAVGDLTGRVPGASGREVRGARAALRPAGAAPAPEQARTASCSTAAGWRCPATDFLAQRPGPVDRDVRAGRPSRPRNPSAGDARRRARRASWSTTCRRDPRANALFLEVLTSPRNPETGAALDERGRGVRPFRSRFRPRRRADAVRHVPPLHGRRAHHPRDRPARAGSSAATLNEDHPLASAIMQADRRRAACSMSRCCCTTSPRGAAATIRCSAPRSRERLCPRFGLTAAETETVAWLVRYHLLMSATAFKRDLSDFKTILDFAEMVQSPERLRLLLALTVVDIRAVGPGVWNGWKRQLLTDLYEAAEEVLRLGHKQKGRERTRSPPSRTRSPRRSAGTARPSRGYVKRLPECLLGRRARRCARSPMRS